MKETSMRYMTIQVERLFIFNFLSLQDGKRGKTGADYL